MDRRAFVGAGISGALLGAAASAQIFQSDPLSNGAMPKEAIAVALAWLNGIDADLAQPAWDQANAYFRASITAADWADRVQQVHSAFGHVRARSFVSAESRAQLPDAPSGDYLIVYFSCDGYRRPYSEIVTLQREEGGWKVAGFFTRSSRAVQVRGVGALPMRWK